MWCTTCPPTAKPGEQLTIEHGGRKFSIHVPAGVVPGQTFRVSLPVGPAMEYDKELGLQEPTPPWDGMPLVCGLWDLSYGPEDFVLLDGNLLHGSHRLAGLPGRWPEQAPRAGALLGHRLLHIQAPGGHVEAWKF